MNNIIAMTGSDGLKTYCAEASTANEGVPDNLRYRAFLVQCRSETLRIKGLEFATGNVHRMVTNHADWEYDETKQERRADPTVLGGNVDACYRRRCCHP